MDLMDLLGGALQQQGGIEQISRETGIDRDRVATVVSGAVPMIMSALAKNSAKPQGAEALASALARDHDGSILDNLTSALGQSAVQQAGAGALGHIFGARQQRATSALGQMSGLDSASVSKILALLAPLVLGALGKSQRAGYGSAAPSGGSIGGIDLGGLVASLAGGRREAERRAPEASVLTQMLDRDGDGDVTDDLAGLGAGLLGSLFKK